MLISFRCHKEGSGSSPADKVCWITPCRIGSLNDSLILIMNNSKTEIQSIAFLRGVACLFVALYHLKSSAPNNSIFYNLFKFGSFGVDLFFMISGFVIVVATARDSKADSF